MGKVEKQIPTTPQSIGIGMIENMILGLEQVQKIERLLRNGVGEDRCRLIFPGEDSYRVAQLAIDVVGNGDPAFIEDIYSAGGKIDELVLMDIGNAIIRGKGNRLKTNEIIQRTREKKGW